jgi:hypothetical protein
MYTTLSDLSPSTTYYVRAYATNSIGTSYSNEVNFTTEDGMPILGTTSVSEITATSADLSGSVTIDTDIPDITQRGFVYSTSSSPTINDMKEIISGSFGNMYTTLSDLSPSTQYYVRAYATNSAGTSYSNWVSFYTLKQLPNNTCNTQISSTLSGSVIYPASGNVLDLGSSINVEWNYPGYSQVHVYLYEDENYVLTIGSWLIDDGQQSWIIPSSLPPSNCYRIVFGINNSGGNPGSLPNENWGNGYVVGENFTIY